MSVRFMLDEQSTMSREQQCSAVQGSGSLTRCVVQKLLASVARPALLRHIGPRASRVGSGPNIINVDVSTIYNGYFSDASRMFMIGDVSPEMRKLVQVTKECMEIGIAAAQPWKQLGDVGAAIQEHAEKNGFSVVRDLCGHGVGMKFHEEPDVEHFGRRGTGMMIVPGMTFTIEPMINMGTYEVFVDEADGWTVCTDDGLPSAQWENMILITETGNEILTY